MSKTGNTILALITGAAIGSAVALLYAPESGEKTRKKISKNAKEAKRKIDKHIHETSESLSQSAQKAKKNFDHKLESTLHSASEKADDILVAMENKLEDLRRKNSKATSKAEDLVDDLKDVKIPKGANA